MTIDDITIGIRSTATPDECSGVIRDLRALADFVEQAQKLRDVEVGFDMVNPAEIRIHLSGTVGFELENARIASPALTDS